MLDREGGSLMQTPLVVLGGATSSSVALPAPPPDALRLVALIYEATSPSAAKLTNCKLVEFNAGQALPVGPDRVVGTAPFAPDSEVPPFGPATQPDLALGVDACAAPMDDPRCSPKQVTAFDVDPSLALLRDAVFTMTGTAVAIGGNGSDDDFLLAIGSDDRVVPLIGAGSTSTSARLRGQPHPRFAPALGIDEQTNTIYGLSSGGTYFQLDATDLHPLLTATTPYGGGEIAVGGDGSSAFLVGPITSSTLSGVFALSRGSPVIAPASGFVPGVDLMAAVSSDRIVALSNNLLETRIRGTWGPAHPQSVEPPSRELSGDADHFLLFGGANTDQLLWQKTATSTSWTVVPAPDPTVGQMRATALLAGDAILIGANNGNSALWLGDHWCPNPLPTGQISFVRWASAPGGREAIGFTQPGETPRVWRFRMGSP
jgi:hypothetical protein